PASSGAEVHVRSGQSCASPRRLPGPGRARPPSVARSPRQRLAGWIGGTASRISQSVKLICPRCSSVPLWLDSWILRRTACDRSEEHTSELQSRGHLVCRLLLEKK